MARPRKEIDKKLFENLCGIQCNEREICDVLEVSDKTLSAWCKRTYGDSFSDVRDKKQVKGKIALRRYQLELAKKNATMAIWLGKQWLGQTDDKNININKQIDQETIDEVEDFLDEINRATEDIIAQS